MKAKIVTDSAGKFYGIRWNCPGCALLQGASGAHVLPVDWTPDGYERSPHSNGSPWGFNGDMERPTFTPSVLSRFPHGEERREHVCHSFVRDGRIEFLSDCTHALAGQTVDLPDIKSEVPA